MGRRSRHPLALQCHPPQGQAPVAAAVARALVAGVAAGRMQLSSLYPIRRGKGSRAEFTRRRSRSTPQAPSLLWQLPSGQALQWPQATGSWLLLDCCHSSPSLAPCLLTCPACPQAKRMWVGGRGEEGEEGRTGEWEDQQRSGRRQRIHSSRTSECALGVTHGTACF